MANGSRKRWKKKRRLEAAEGQAAGSRSASGWAADGGGLTDAELEDGEIPPVGPTPASDGGGGADQRSKEEGPPTVDPAVESLVGPWSPKVHLTFIDSLPAPSCGFSERSRIRTRAILRGLAYLDVGVTYDCYVYVRPDTTSPDGEGFEVPNDGHRLVVTLHGGELIYFTLLTNPSLLAAGSREVKALHDELLSCMEWQMTHMPQLIRKSPIHVGMPGIFHALSVHLSQHGGSVGQIELTTARERCRCTRQCTADEQHTEWWRRRDIARQVVHSHAQDLNRTAPSEYGRQASEVENYLTPYEAHRKVLEEAKLEDQDGFCQSAANKTAIDHGDGNNHGQFNMLYFSAPELIWWLLHLDPDYDLGLWAMERGRVWTRLRPGLGLIFNSAAGHCVLPHKHLLRYVCDVEGLRRAATKYSTERTELALAYVCAEPDLMRGFAEAEQAAQFQSSLVGTTTYQQSGITHQCLRAAQIGRPERLLYHSWQAVPETQALETQPMSQEAKRAADREMQQRLLELHEGMCVRVVWETGEVHTATVVETKPALEIRDVGVRLRYASGRVLEERLGCMEWKAMRVPGSVSEGAPAEGRRRRVC